MVKAIRVLLIEDDIVDVKLIENTLRSKKGSSYEIHHVDNLRAATDIDSDDFDVILLDLSLPDSDGLNTADRIIQAFPSVPVIVLTGSESPNLGQDVVKLGAQDFCTKGEVDTYPLVRTIQYAILRKRMQKLEIQVQETQRLESLGVLAGGIAHDFNNMLLSVMGNVDLAMMKLKPESASIEHLHGVKTAAVRLAELTNQMLAYAGKGRFALENLNLSSIVDEMGHLLQVTVSKDVTIHYDLERNLPSIEADPSQIRQVVLNLITNAADAMADKSGVIRLSTGLMDIDNRYLRELMMVDEIPTGRYIYLEVSDTGNGIEPKNQKKIFEPFYTTKFSGRGLGLAAVLGIVNGHGGAIKIYSEPGKGSTFKVLLPCHHEELPVPTDQEVLSDWVGEGTVLVVDDEESVRDITKSYAEVLGFDCLTAEDGLQAIDVMNEHKAKIAVVILDLTMPKMDGYETFRKLRQIVPNLKILLISGYNEQEAISDFTGKGLAAFLQKPYDLSSLRKTLKKILAD